MVGIHWDTIDEVAIRYRVEDSRQPVKMIIEKGKLKKLKVDKDPK
jgi:hypothetical protein